jgi:hypothetical protein
LEKFADEKFIRLGFFIGGIYDITLGLGVIFVPDLLLSIFKLTKPEIMIFVYSSGLFLLAVGYYLLYACFHDVKNYFFIGVGSSLVRFTFTLIILLLWLIEGIELAYILVACTDTLTGFFIILPIAANNGLSRKELWIKM